MMKRILSFLLAFLMVVSIFPAPAYATDSTDVTITPTETPTEAATETPCPTCGTVGCTSEHLTWCPECKVDDCGKTHVFCEICQKNDCGQNHCPTCGTIDCTTDHGAPAAETPEEPEVHPMVGKVVKLKSDLTSYSGYRGENLSVTLMSKDGYPSVMKVTAVLEKNDVVYCRLAAVEGSWSFPEYDDNFYLESTKLEAAVWCTECEEYDCGEDHSQPTDPTDPPVAPEVPELDDGESGVVLKGTFPTDVSLSVEPADVSGQLSQFGVSGEKLVFGLDISLMRSGVDYQPGAAVRVKVPVSADVGTKIGILHTHGGETTYMGLTEVLADGTVEFTTDRFSTFAGFTVDFHYNEIDYSIAGLTSIKLSELFVALEIDRNAAHVIDVTYSDPSQIEVTRIDGDWQLESLKAFDTEETLEITFYDGEIITIKVTDSRVYFNFGSTGVTGHTKDNLVEGTGTKDITVILYDGNTGVELARSTVKNVSAYSYVTLDGGEKYWLQVKSIDGGSKLTDNPYGSEDQHHICLTYARTGDVTIQVYCWPSAIPETGSSNFCTIRRLPKVVANSSHTETRNVHVWVKRNGSYVKVEEFNGLTFPDRNGDKNGHDVINADLDLTVSAKKGYTYISKSDDGNRTYNVYLEPTSYTISYMLDGGSASNPTSYNIETATFTLKEPTKTGYSFLGWTGSNGSTPQKTVTIEQGTTGNKSYTANWEAEPVSYTVTWKNEDGTVLETDTGVEYGKTPTYNGATPTKAATAECTYTFKSWSPDISAVTGNVTYTATYTETKNKYKVTFVDEDGTVLKEATEYEYGTPAASIVKPTNPTKEATAEFTYTFAAWTPEITDVTKDAVYTATYTQETKMYNVTGTIDNGGVVTNAQQSVAYNEENIQMVFTPADGYKIIGIKVNGNSIATFYPHSYSFCQIITAQTTVEVTTSCVEYTISYELNGGLLADGVTNPATYTIETETFTLNNPMRAGYKFKGWATSENATTGTESITIEKGSTGNKTYYAVWERSLVDLTITTTSADQEQSFIFTVSGTPSDSNYGTITLDVVLVGTDSITIKDLPVGEYTVTEKDGWSWRENTVSSQTADLRTTSQTVSFDFHVVDDLHWLSGYSYKRKKGGS